MIKTLVKEFIAFVIERHCVYLRRANGSDKPWTKDKILQSYRFCNVYRELDTVTRWIDTNWRTPHTADPNLWFAMAFARLFNKPATLAAVGWPAPWSLAGMRSALLRYERSGAGVFSGAYIVSTNGVTMPKVPYLCEMVLNPMWKARKDLQPAVGDTLRGYANKMVTANGFKGFMSGQVIADLKYATGCPLNTAPDWHTFAIGGPGSKRGLNRVTGRIVLAPWNDRQWHLQLLSIREQLNAAIPSDWEPLHAQDVQNCLCEFDKYTRTKLGEGRPRSTYPGK